MSKPKRMALIVAVMSGMMLAQSAIVGYLTANTPPVPVAGKAAPRLRVTLPGGSVHNVAPTVAKPAVSVRAASCRVGVSVKVRCTWEGCEYATSWGAGTLVAPGRVLTCSHLFDEGNDGLSVFFAGKSYKAKLLKRDPKPDMALLAVEGVAVVPTGYVDVLREGEPVTLCGYGGDGNLKATVGHFKKWAGLTDGRHSFYMDVKNRSGDSGGGAFNSAGQLVGVQWGCPEAGDPDGTAVSSGEPMVRFLWGDQ